MCAKNSATATANLRRRRATLELRSRVLQALRNFFLSRDFIEVETPVRIPTPALELYIDAEPCGDHYLRTSPELRLKQLIVAGYELIFELGPCFRRGEKGPFHNPEYTMLEWYRAGADYRNMLADTRELLVETARQVLGQTSFRYGCSTVELDTPWQCLTVEEAFLKFAGWNPLVGFDPDRFDEDLVGKVEPALARDRPVVLMDYPLERAALARCRRSVPPVAERWELYIAGIEIANAFSELTDAEEQRRRFLACAEERRRMGRDVYSLNEMFLAALAEGMPQCGGTALGVDRLVMLLTDSPSIGEVRAFV